MSLDIFFKSIWTAVTAVVKPVVVTISYITSYLYQDLSKLSQTDFNKLSADAINGYAKTTAGFSGASLIQARQDQLAGWLNANPAAAASLTPKAWGFFTPWSVSQVSEAAAKKISAKAWMEWIKAPPAQFVEGLFTSPTQHSSLQLSPQIIAGSFSNVDLATLASMGQKLNSAQMQKWLAAHPQTPISSLSAVVFSAFVGGVLNTIDAVPLNNLTASQLSYLGSDEIAALTSKTLNTFSSRALSGLSAPQLSQISVSAFSGLDVSKFNNLSGALLGVTPQQIASLSEGKFAQISANLLSKMANAWSGITSRQLTAWLAQSGNILGALPVNILTSMSPTMLAQLDASHIASMTAAQAKALRPTQIAALGANFGTLLKVLPTGTLSDYQWSMVGAAEIGSLTPTQVASLSPSVLAKLGRGAISALTAGEFAGLSKAALQAISPEALKGASVSALQALGVNKRTGLTTAQLAALTPAQTAAFAAHEKASLAGKGLKTIGVAPMTWQFENTVSLVDVTLMASAAYITGQAAPATIQLAPSPKWMSIMTKTECLGAETEFFGVKAEAWKNSVNNKTIVIAFSGTDIFDYSKGYSVSDGLLPDFSDILMDVGMGAQSLGIDSEILFWQQIKIALDFYYEVKRANPVSEVVFTGQSLGGALASTLGAILDTKAIGFDEPPVRPSLLNPSFIRDVSDWLAAHPDLDAKSRTALSKFISAGDNTSALIASRAAQISAYRIDGEALSMAIEIADSLGVKDGRIARDVHEIAAVGGYSPTLRNAVKGILDWGSGKSTEVTENPLLIVEESVFRHWTKMLVATSVSPAFVHDLASLGNLTHAIYDLSLTFNGAAPLDAMVADYSVKQKSSTQQNSTLIRFSNDLLSLTDRSSAWLEGTGVSMGLISAAAYQYAFATSQTAPIFSNIGNGVMAKLTEMPESNAGKQKLSDAVVKRSSVLSSDELLQKMVDERFRTTTNWAVSDESSTGFYFDASALDESVVAIGDNKAENMIKGGSSDMVAIGGNAQNWLTGGDGNDILVGGNNTGNWLDGGAGYNMLIGGLQGVDIFSFSAISDDSVYNFSNSYDILDFCKLEASLGIKLRYSENAMADSGAGSMWFDAGQSRLSINLGQSQAMSVVLSGVSTLSSASVRI